MAEKSPAREQAEREAVNAHRKAFLLLSSLVGPDHAGEVNDALFDALTADRQLGFVLGVEAAGGVIDG